MINSNITRSVLWVGVAFNALVALMLMFPATLGALAALPPIGSDFYRWMLSYFVVLFSATYAWLALAPTISQPVVALAAIGKAGSFMIALVCLYRADIQLKTFAISVADLAFAIYFFVWLRSTPVSASNA
ncbi:MAG: hypothetical protein ACREO1_01650 [Arenimonas sp.]